MLHQSVGEQMFDFIKRVNKVIWSSQKEIRILRFQVFKPFVRPSRKIDKAKHLNKSETRQEHATGAKKIACSRLARQHLILSIHQPKELHLSCYMVDQPVLFCGLIQAKSCWFVKVFV